MEAQTEARKSRFAWPPPGDEEKQFHAEVAAPAAILEALGADIRISPPAPENAKGKAIKPEKWRSLRDWLADQSGAMGGLIAGGGHSWNQPQLVMAARGLVFGDWGDAGKLMAMQAGRIPGEGMAALLDGEEPRSTDYDPLRWAAEFLFMRSDQAPAALRDDARTVLKRQLALAGLGMVPWTDTSGDLSNARGELWHHGPSLSPVGERSPKTSNADQLGIVQRAFMGHGGNDREGFAGWVARERYFSFTPSIPEGCVELLAGVPVFGTFVFVEYPEGRLVFRPQQLNGNTPSALWSWADHATRRQTRGFPFGAAAKNRGKGAPRSLGCTIEDGEVVARSTDDRFTARFRLPTSKPIWVVVVDGKGARFESPANALKAERIQ